MRTAVGRYWDEYYSTAERLADRYAENVRIFDMRAALNTDATQRQLLDFVRIPRSQQLISMRIVLNANT